MDRLCNAYHMSNMGLGELRFDEIKVDELLGVPRCLLMYFDSTRITYFGPQKGERHFKSKFDEKKID